MDDRNDDRCKCQHYIIIENLIEGETLTYSLALIKGEIRDKTNNNINYVTECSSNHIVVKNDSRSTTTYWPVVKLKFKCLIELSTGQNEISLSFCNIFIRIVLNYVPRNTEYFVTPIYLICKNHDGNFQAPSCYDNSIDCARRRIALGTKLIQTLIAEKLCENKFGRKTFQIESDVNSNAEDCVRFYSDLTVEEARCMDQEALWVYFGREIMKSNLCSNKRKFLAFLSATWWDGSESGRIKAHAALGGGGLALFGTGCLYTWPERVEDVISCFLDTTPVDTRHFMDDSCFRGTYGGCFSTTLGSVCHELGHTFDLGHSKDGIMGRGFDNIDLVFLPLSHYFQNRHQFMRYITVQLISKLNVECIITTPTTTLTSTTLTNSNSSCSSTLSSPSSSSSPYPLELVNNNNFSAHVVNNGRHSPNVRNKNISNKMATAPSMSGGNASTDDDKTYWSPSCAAILAYHRWFNNENEDALKKQNLKYDNIRGVVMSTSGIRVVELRGENGLILHSWQFTASSTKHQLVVPLQVASRAQLIVIEDSCGNILKQELKTNLRLNH